VWSSALRTLICVWDENSVDFHLGTSLEARVEVLSADAHNDGVGRGFGCHISPSLASRRCCAGNAIGNATLHSGGEVDCADQVAVMQT
jgi:hypothetical protein